MYGFGLVWVFILMVYGILMIVVVSVLGSSHESYSGASGVETWGNS